MTTRETPHFSQASLDCAAGLKTRMVATSATAGWTSCVLDHMEGDGFADRHETRVTPDLKFPVALRGESDCDHLLAGRWRSSIYQAGAVGIVPAGETTRLKWRNRTRSPFRMAYLYMPPAFILQAAELVRRPGQRLSADLAPIVVVNDQAVASIVASLVWGMEVGAPDIYAETGLRWLALHLVSHYGGRSVDDFGARDTIALTDARLARAVEFMTANLARPITIAEIAREACASPFHFSRLFARRLGLPPHAYLTRCRMEKAHRLLATTDLPITAAAAECGYPVGSSFSSAFSRYFGQAPSAISRPLRR